MLKDDTDPRRLTGAPFEVQRAFLVDAVLADPAAKAVLEGARDLGLPDHRLVSGAVYQNVWNALSGKPGGHGVKDYDLAYFDDSDLSWEAEDGVIQRCAEVFAGLCAEVEVRNQARVHLWFGPKYGVDFAPLTSTDAGIARYAAPAHMVGVRMQADGSLDVCAPRGLNDVFAMIVRLVVQPADIDGFLCKFERQKALWPEIALVIQTDSKAG